MSDFEMPEDFQPQMSVPTFPRPSKAEVDAAKAEMRRENQAAEASRNTRENIRVVGEIARRAKLPPEDPEHICGLFCDGQDGSGSDCARLRLKLFGTTGTIGGL